MICLVMTPFYAILLGRIEGRHQSWSDGSWSDHWWWSYDWSQRKGQTTGIMRKKQFSYWILLDQSLITRTASPLIELITQRNELNLIAHPFSVYINILKHGKKQSVFCIPVLYSVMSLYFVARWVHADDNPMSAGILQIWISRVKYQKRNIPPFIKKKSDAGSQTYYAYI